MMNTARRAAAPMTRASTIKRRLISMSALASAIALVLAGCGFIGYYIVAARHALTVSVPVQAGIVGRNSISALRFDDDRDAADTLAALRSDPDVITAAIYDADGQLFAAYAPIDGVRVRPELAIASGQSALARFEQRTLEVYEPIASDGERLGTVYISYSLDRLWQDVRRFLAIALVVLIVSVIAVVPLSARIQRRFSDPIARLAAVAEEVSRSRDYRVRVAPSATKDELGELIDTFNDMLVEIQARHSEVEAARDQLRKSEESYRRLFASNPHAMWVYDVETLRFVDVNDMALERYGYSRDEFLAMTIKDIRPATDVPALLDCVTRPRSTDAAGIWKHRTKDGTIIDVDVSSHELTMSGRPARVVLAHDITERLRAERALQESEALFRGMAETMPHVVWTARPDGQREYFNRRWFEYTGLSLETTSGMGWQSAIHQDDRQRVMDLWTRAVQTGGAHEVVYRLRRHDGEIRWQIGRSAPLHNDQGEVVMWVGTITDIDDARRAEETLKSLNAELEQRVLVRTADLQAANRELESFSYSVSHDLRAPLRHVQGYVDMLASASAGKLCEKSQRYLQTITDATVEMGDLIDSLLAFSRIGRVQMSEGRIALDDLVADVIRGLEMSTRGRRIRWTIAPLPDVVGDASLLKQVYANLLGNAVKYTRPRDPAEIEVGCTRGENGGHVLFVRDNGAGFDMRYAHKLFGVFQRLHRADEFEGTGIGLATVQRIIARHGGRTWAEGAIDAGATIYFTLPATVPAAQSVRAS